MHICKRSVVGNNQSINKHVSASKGNSVSWRVSRLAIGGRLHGIRCGWFSKEDGEFNTVKSIAPNGEIVFHSADMADIAVRMIKTYSDLNLNDLPVSAYVKVGTSAVKIFSGSYEFANAFHSHWQGTTVIQNLILVHSSSPSDDFMRERCGFYNGGGDALVMHVRELFSRSTDLSAEQRRVNQLRVDLTSQCVMNKSTLEDRGIISTWRKVCEIFGFRGSRIGTSMDNACVTAISKTTSTSTTSAYQTDISEQRIRSCFASDLVPHEPQKKVDLFEQARIKQGKSVIGRKSVDLNTSGLFSKEDLTASAKRVQAQIANINRLKGLPDGFRFKVTHLNSDIDIFLLQVIKDKSDVVAAIPMKSLSSTKKMVKLLSNNFKCDKSPSFIDGIKNVSLSLFQVNGFGRNETLIFVGDDEQIDFFCSEWKSGVFSSSIAISFTSSDEVLTADLVEYRVNTVKTTSCLVNAE